MSPFVLLVLAYAAGATPTSLWLGKAVYGVDLRTKGSGNLGGTNTLRVLGWKAALPVILMDIGKGWFPVWYFPQIQQGTSAAGWALAYGGAAVLGHVFSFWVGFKGGKGIATSAGVLLALAPVAVSVCIGLWLGVVALTRVVSVASLSAALTLPVAVYLFPPGEGTAILWFAGALSFLAIWAHRSNIGRLMRGEEGSFRETAPVGGPAQRAGPSLEQTPGPSPEQAPERDPEQGPETGEDPA